MRAGGTLLAGVDRALLAAAFAERLHAAGIGASQVCTNRFAAALAVVDPRTTTELYWVARTSLVDDVEQLEVFDRVFEAVFGGGALSLDPIRRAAGAAPPPREDSVDVPVRAESARLPGGGGVAWATAPSAAAEDDAQDEGSLIAELSPAYEEQLSDVPFDQLDERELALVGALVEQLATRWPMRPARRRRRSHRGSAVDHRRTLRAALRTGGEPVRLVRSTQVRRPRRVVVLADVSASMRTWTRVHLHLLRALGRHGGAEAFLFATGVTRVTAALRHRSPQVAVERANEAVADRFGGTRIASAVATLLRDPAWSTLLRGAVVVVVSDGWDADDPVELDRRMRRLHRMAHRVVWVNPRTAAPGYEPLVGGMAAAGPHCDAVVSGHTLAAVAELFELLADHRAR